MCVFFLFCLLSFFLFFSKKEILLKLIHENFLFRSPTHAPQLHHWLRKRDSTIYITSCIIFFSVRAKLSIFINRVIKVPLITRWDAKRARRRLFHDTIFISIMFMYFSLDNINNLNTSGTSGTNACIRSESHFTNETVENFSHTNCWMAFDIIAL